MRAPRPPKRARRGDFAPTIDTFLTLRNSLTPSSTSSPYGEHRTTPCDVHTQLFKTLYIITITPLPHAPSLGDEEQPAGTTIEFLPNGTTFLSNVTISIPYNDVNNDGFVDFTGASENDLLLYVHDPNSLSWQRFITGSIKYFTFRHQRKAIKATCYRLFDVMFLMTGLVTFPVKTLRITS